MLMLQTADYVKATGASVGAISAVPKKHIAPPSNSRNELWIASVVIKLDAQPRDMYIDRLGISSAAGIVAP